MNTFPDLICLDCLGGKFINGIGCPGGKIISLPCSRCKQTGFISEEESEWIKIGRRYANRRRDDDVSLRERAKQLGIPASLLSDCELGKVNPRKYLK